MTYDPTNWKSGDLITSEGLNKIEQELVKNDTNIEEAVVESNRGYVHSINIGDDGIGTINFWDGENDSNYALDSVDFFTTETAMDPEKAARFRDMIGAWDLNLGKDYINDKTIEVFNDNFETSFETKLSGHITTDITESETRLVPSNVIYTTLEGMRNTIEENKLSKSDIDSQLTEESENPVQNKIITQEINDIKAKLGEKSNIPKGELKVHFLNFDTTLAENETNKTFGDCTIISGEKNGIIDFGNDSSGTDLIAYLKENQIQEIDFAVISHYHNDHIGTTFSTLLNNLINNEDFKIDFTNCIFYLPHKNINFDSLQGVSALKNRQIDVLAKLNELHISYFFPDNNQTIQIPNSNIYLRFLNIANNDNYYNDYYNYKTSQDGSNISNNTNYNIFSMITELKHFNNTFLFTGDLTFPAMERNYQYINNCDVYKIEHHSLEGKVSLNWLNKISPKYAIYMPFDKDYAVDNPKACYKKTLIELAKKGTIVFAATPNSVTVQSTYNQLELLEGNPIGISFEEMSAPEIIEPNTDLNDLKDIGSYTSQNADITHTLNNTPYTSGGFLLEVKRTSTYHSSNRIQFLYPNSRILNTFYTRVFTTGASSTDELKWGNWVSHGGPRKLENIQCGNNIIIEGNSLEEPNNTNNSCYRAGQTVTLSISLKATGNITGQNQELLTGLPPRIGPSYFMFIPAYIYRASDLIPIPLILTGPGKIQKPGSIEILENDLIRFQCTYITSTF